MEELEFEVIEIDNKPYIILDKISDNNSTYYYLSNENDPEDFFVQKLNNQEELISLSSKEEFDKAMSLYLEKYN